MSNYISNILVVFACPSDDSDKRLGEISKLCKLFNQNCTSRGLNVDLIDLYNEKEFLAKDYLPPNDSKVLEYQIRINRADLVVFFHPVWLDTVPAVLKGFLENVLTNGFAYQNTNRLPQGLLSAKKSLVFAFDTKSGFDSSFIFGNQLYHFWTKSIFHLTGMKGRLFIVNDFRSANSKTVQNWQNKILKVANNLKVKPSVIDF
jgi:putative NADPH-quinone reductase